MCGILGQIAKKGELNVNSCRFEEALNLQYHRGPDDHGIYLDRNKRFVFGHRRLSIIDLSCHSRQPMSILDGDIVIVFNGEIYNFNEIRDYLAKKGYSFRTSSDTEVILYAYLDEGIECLRKFIGMFAFALFDKRDGNSYIVRDRLGVKPVYIYDDGERITFSSEIKSILHLFPSLRDINYSAISSYLSFRYPILDDSFFIGIDSIPPGHYLKIDSFGNSHLKRYWFLDKFVSQQEEDKGEAYYINNLREMLSSSVKYRMISDVPFGAFLSGGVDSSVIVSIMSRMVCDRPIKTFSIGFPEDGYNELEYARLVSSMFRTDHKEIILSGSEYMGAMERMIEYKDAPLSVPNEVALYLMSKELKKDITVVLSGEGADEIFGGYGRIFRSSYDYERLLDAKCGRLSLEDRKVFEKNFRDKYKSDVFSSEVDHFLSLYSYVGYKEKRSLINKSIPMDSIEENLRDRFVNLFDEVDGADYASKMMYCFERIHLVGLLQRVDASTMAASVEARVPFVDHRLVEFSFTVPTHYKLKWKSEKDKLSSRLITSDYISERHDIPKFLLKKAYEKDLPRNILYRRKMGFPVPLSNWFGGDFNSYAKDILLDDSTKRRSIYDIDHIERLLKSMDLDGSHDMALELWMLVNLELFFRKYIN